MQKEREREMTNAYILLVAKPNGKYHLEYVDLDGRVILKMILEK
jgi:hypothetical protein